MVDWKKRILTGTIAVPLLFLMVHYRFTSVILAHVAIFLAQKEYKHLVKNILEKNSLETDHFYVNSMNSSYLSLLPSHLFLQGMSYFTEDCYIHLFYFITILLICLLRIIDFITITSFLTKNEVPATANIIEKRLYILSFFQICADIFGFTMFTFPLSFPIIFTNYPKGIGFLLFWFISTWQSDNGALFFGSLFGKRPLAPLVSPKKTIEGVYGALFFSVFTGLIMSFYNDSGSVYFPNIPRTHYIFLSFLIAAVSVFGDFVESFVKRTAGVKDSGSLFPGHGGMLDRLDSLVISAPIMYFYAKIYVDFNTLN